MLVCVCMYSENDSGKDSESWRNVAHASYEYRSESVCLCVCVCVCVRGIVCVFSYVYVYFTLGFKFTLYCVYLA